MPANLFRAHAFVCPLLLTFLWAPCASAQDGSSAEPEATAQRSRGNASWRRPFQPFRLIDNIYYVGTEGLAIYLIATPEGHILLDTGLADTLPLVRDGIEKLGFRVADIKIMISSHAHYDHVQGHPQMQKWSGARVLAMAGDAEAIGSGTNPTRVERVLDDGDKVALGGETLTAHLTAGHTKGDTTWTMEVEDDGQRYQVVFFGSTTILGRLLGNRNYPNMAEDYQRTYARLKALPCDVFLAPHGNFYNLEEKFRQHSQGNKPNPFIDPEGYRTYITRAEQAFLAQLSRERAEAERRTTP